MKENVVIVNFYKSHSRPNDVIYIGILVYRSEYFYTKYGISCKKPMTKAPYKTVNFGFTKLHPEEVLKLMKKLQKYWSASNYDAKHHNAGHFLNEVLVHLHLTNSKKNVKNSQTSEIMPGIDKIVQEAAKDPEMQPIISLLSLASTVLSNVLIKYKIVWKCGLIAWNFFKVVTKNLKN